jgi:hydrogenase-4 component B
MMPFAWPPITWFWLMSGGYAVAAAGSLSPWRRLTRALVSAGLICGAAAGVGLAASVFASGRPFVFEAPAILAAAGGLTFCLDTLGAFFLALIGLVAIPVGLYTFGYTAALSRAYSLRWSAFMLAVFVCSMSLVVMAGNPVTFVLAWELMAASSFFLVITEHDRPETVHAGLWYMAMTHAGLLALLAAFYLLAGGDAGATFATMRASSPALPAVVRNAVFVLALIGFGSKAGLVPLHVWLPRAHPEAPSHVSALMSGVMVKLGIYGLLRICLDLLGGGPFWWGATLTIIGAASALTGVLYALVSNDLKRLLAFSTVENVGLILLGLGSGFVFLNLRQPVAATVAFSAALLHSANHAAFKSVLFLSAGSVLHGTGLRDMNRMGGLIKRSPWTAAAFLVGAMAIAGLPPLNGFASEWLLFQSFLPGVASSRAPVAMLLTLGVGALALTGGLAAATFVKAFGISFLAIPRSNEAAHAHECGWSMRAGMVLLALACPLMAVTTVPLLAVVSRVLTGLGGLPAAGVSFGSGIVASAPEGIGRISPIVIMLVVLTALASVTVLWRVIGNQQRRVGDTWGCGRMTQTPRMEYTSTAFAEPLRRVFSELYRPSDDLTVSSHDELPYHVKAMRYRMQLHPWFDRVIYDPLVAGVVRAASWARVIQNGSVNAYIAYMVAVLVLLLGVVLAY